MTDLLLTYTQLKARLAEALGRVEVPPGTLSRWMQNLGYPKGKPGQKRQWDLEDLVALTAYGQAFQMGLGGQDAIDYAVSQVERFRQWPSTPTNSSAPSTPTKATALPKLISPQCSSAMASVGR